MSADFVTDYFDPKQENLSYTVGIIKPETCLSQKNVQAIIDKIEAEGFIIKNMIQRELNKQEIRNVFYKHVNKSYYDQINEYMQSGESVVMLLCHEKENPIEKWKKMIGPMNPEQAKKDAATSLRAVYGINLIKNELYGSDNYIEANKERDIFKFPIPQKIPEFHFDKMKVTLDTLFKFIFPPDLEHPSVNQRLDVFALYGPAVNYHSVDKCFCIKCSRVGKEILEIVRKEKIMEEKEKLGVNTKNDATMLKLEQSMSTSKKGQKGVDKFQIPPIRLLNEINIQRIYKALCPKCQEHCDKYSHLCGGRDFQHVMSNQEINELAKEINKKEILDLLTIEKGNAATIMIETISLEEPIDIVYNKDLIKILLQDLPTDYYNRFEFYDMQQIILEDRRIRMNAWMSILINKPIDRFINPKLIDPTVTMEQRKDLKSVHFTLNRTLPLSMTVKKKNISFVPMDLPPSISDKTRLQQNEENFALLQKLHRHTTHIVSIDDINKGDSYKISVNLMRNYNEGRHGSWNNYCTLKGKDKGTYVQSKNFPINKEFE